MMMLVVIQGVHQGQRYPVFETRMVFGRDRKVEIHLGDEGVSRRHAAIFTQKAAIWIEDLGSTNGTFVNNMRISEPCRIKHNDRIALGETIMQVQENRSLPVQRVVLSDTHHDSKSLIKVDLNATSVFEVLKKDESTVFPADSVTTTLLSLHQFSLQISGILDMEELLEASLGMMIKASGAERGAILLSDQTGNLVPRARFLKEKVADRELLVSSTFVNEVLESREGLLSAEAAKDERYRHTQAISLGQITSMMCAPLLVKDRVLGVVYADVSMNVRPLTEMNLRMLSAMTMELCTAIENARLYAMLKDSEEFSSCVLKSITGGLLVVNTEGRILRMNDTGARFSGLSMGEILGVMLKDLPVYAEMEALVAKTLQCGRPQEQETLSLYPFGKPQIPVAVTSAALEDYNGNTIGAVVHFRDITRLHQLAEEVKRAERLSALGQMASGIAHEIRNPLNSVQGFVQIMQEATENPEHRNFCGIVLEEVNRMNHIVQDMLDFSRQQSISLSRIELAPILRHVVKLVENQAQERGVNLRYETEGKYGVKVLGNQEKLIQIFLNILNNAIQATPSGGKVAIGESVLGEKMGREESIKIYIRDTGCGMNSTVLAQIFNPFFTTRDHGTGLGLSICQKLIEQHFGHISVESIPDKGSCFTIELPIES